MPDPKTYKQRRRCKETTSTIMPRLQQLGSSLPALCAGPPCLILRLTSSILRTSTPRLHCLLSSRMLSAEDCRLEANVPHCYNDQWCARDNLSRASSCYSCNNK